MRYNKLFKRNVKKINNRVQFERIIKTLLAESEDKPENYESLPWSLEIVNDPSKGAIYNELGDLIIKLYEFRAKL